MKDLDEMDPMDDGFPKVPKPPAACSLVPATTATTTRVDSEKKKKKKKHHHHYSKQRSFKAGDKDVKFDNYDGETTS